MSVDDQPASQDTSTAARAAASGGKGFAARRLRVAAGTAPEDDPPAAALRPALARVGGKRGGRAGAGPASGKTAAKRSKPASAKNAKGARAEQAALGLLAGRLKADAPLDDAALRDCLQRLDADELARLGRLLAQVRADGRGKRWNGPAEAAADRGVVVEVHGDNNTVTVAPAAQRNDQWRGDQQRQPWRKPWAQQALGRQIGRMRRFVDGR